MGERVWDRFLTEQDKAHLAMSRDRRVGFGERPALLLIDLYRWVFGDAPVPLLEGLRDWPGYCGPAGWQALPHIQQLLHTARAAGIPVVHVTGLHPDESGVMGWNEAAHGGAPRQTRDDPLAHDRVRRQYDIMEQVAPIPGEAVLRKTAPSAFWGTPLVAHLNQLRVDTLLVAGETTSGCVRASVVDGCSYRYKMIVVEECVFDRHEACHAINLFDMHQKYADVVRLDTALAYLRQCAAPVQRVPTISGAVR
ncbi:MAG TPA: isochorismatase family protein [Chloroflexota bacterium]|nr:isochorismatase family protein [Chloroflexota bacterium]